MATPIGMSMARISAQITFAEKLFLNAKGNIFWWDSKCKTFFRVKWGLARGDKLLSLFGFFKLFLELCIEVHVILTGEVNGVVVRGGKEDGGEDFVFVDTSW